MRIVTALLLGSLAACAIYGIPEGTPTAMLRLTTDTPGAHFSLPCSTDTLLVKQALVGNPHWAEQSELKMYGTRPDKNSEVIERLIPADRELAFFVNGGRRKEDGQGYGCSLTMSFVARAGEQYEASYRWIGDRCTVNVYRLSTGNQGIQKTPLEANYAPGRRCPYE
jgi:hypothetical protein